MSTEKPGKRSRSHLFTIRVWQEEVGPDQTEWRGKVHPITDGSMRSFRGWEGPVPLLLTTLSEVETLSEPNT